MATDQDEEFDPLSDPEERGVLYAALDSFRQYRQAAHYNITHLRRQSFYSLPTAQIDLLSSPPFNLPETFSAVDDAIDSNAELAETILATGLSSFELDADDAVWKGKASPNDLDKARSTIRQFYRDWSSEGRQERDASYTPIVKALNSFLPVPEPSQRSGYRVLVPGAGLGRLVLEICAEGYTVEGNEISYHQILASSYILNCTHSAGQHDVFPWALGYSNHLSRANQLQSVAVPDIHPGVELEARSKANKIDKHFSERMSMTAGDFCALYKEDEYAASFDAVATCFFIDTAPNFLRYVETIKHCLKPGGVWINLGPLLWHFESNPTPAERERERQQTSSSSHHHEQGAKSHHHGSQRAQMKPRDDGIGEPGSFELSNDEVIALVRHFGFAVEGQAQAPATGYIQDPASMVQNKYHPVLWVARKEPFELKDLNASVREII